MTIVITREAVQVDSPKQFEESNSMLWELREVLVDHSECWLKDSIENGRYLRSQQMLRKASKSSIKEKTRRNIHQVVP